MAKTPDEMAAAIFRTIEEKTSRSGEQWIVLTRARAPRGRKEAIEWLKREHGLGHVTASQIVRKAREPEGFVPPADQERRLRRCKAADPALPWLPRIGS